MRRFQYSTNRTVCEVLEAMRKCCQTSNFSYLPGLIEETQNMVNRMEAALYDKGDLDSARREIKTLKKEIRELEQKRDDLNETS